MFTKRFWIDAAERSLCTFCETLIGFFTIDTAITAVHWKDAILVALTAMIVTLLKCMVVGLDADQERRGKND